jgi:hypothetical protein
VLGKGVWLADIKEGRRGRGKGQKQGDSCVMGLDQKVEGVGIIDRVQSKRVIPASYKE